MTKQIFAITLIFFILTISLLCFAEAQTIEVNGSNFNWNFSNGQSFMCQDTINNVNVTFTVISGAFNASGAINVNSAGGAISATPSTVGSLQITATATIYLYYNGVYINSNTYSYTVGNAFIIGWTYTAPQPTPSPTPTPAPYPTPTPTPTPAATPSGSPTPIPTATPPAFIKGKTNGILYLRSDVYTTNNVTAYGLGNTNSASAQTITDTLTTIPIYGFRIFIVHWDGSSTELTSGIPIALIAPYSGVYTNTWTPSQTSLDMGYDAIQVNVYLLFNTTNPSWVLRAIYISRSLESKTLLSQTWTFILDTSESNITSGSTVTYNSAFSFGGINAVSCINDVGFTQPNNWDVQTGALSQGNILLFILYPYVAVIGMAAYLLIMLIPVFTLYARYRDSAPVIFFFVIFAAPTGASVWLFIPQWAAGAVDGILLFLFAALIWRAWR